MKFKFPLWIIYALIGVVLSYIHYLITNQVSTFLTDTAFFSMVFLALTLIPGNIGKILTRTFGSVRKVLIFLISKRRDFGITFGVTILIHGVFAEAKFYNFDILKAFTVQLIPGGIALALICIMLITSNFSIQKIFRGWKILHSVIWFVVPVVLVHGIFASIQYKGEFGLVNIITIFLLIFAFAKFVIGAENSQKVRDMILIVSGIFVGSIIAFLNLLAISNQNALDLKLQQQIESSSSSSISLNSLSSESISSSESSSSVSSSNSSITSFIFSSSSSKSSSSTNSIMSMMSQVPSHNSVSSCWVSYNGRVYDITPYIGDHPGGMRAILKVCGLDLSVYDSAHTNRTGISFSDPQVTQILQGLQLIPSL